MAISYHSLGIDFPILYSSVDGDAWDPDPCIHDHRCRQKIGTPHNGDEEKRAAVSFLEICKSGIPFVNQGVQMQIERTPAESRDGDASALQKVKNQKPLNRHSYTWFTALPFFRRCFRGKFEHLVGPSSYCTCHRR